MVPLHGKGEPPRAGGWPGELKRWCERMEKCAQKPSRRRVHALRASTLRLEAELNARSQRGALNPAAARAAQRWERHAQRVRRLLGPVRDADVCLELLETFHGPGADAASEESPVAHDWLRAIACLERAFRRRRQSACRRMIASLRVERVRIAASARELGRVLSVPAKRRFDRNAALRNVAEKLVADAPGLTPATLHSFRKHAKTGRYLAERAPLQDAYARRVGLHCRAIQTAIGQWRDWYALAACAERLLARGAGKDLVSMLAGIAGRLRDEALWQCLQASAALADHAHPDLAQRPVQGTKRAVARRIA
jgi:CHAD domain-containing protein